MSVRVLHVVDSERRRGAEIFASGLVRALNERDVEQHVVVLDGAGEPAVRYVAPTTRLPSEGRTLPGLRVRVATARALRRIVDEWAPDIVQAHGGDTIKYSALAMRKSGARLVLRAIGSPPAWVRRGPRRAVYGHLMRRATCVVAVAEAVRREVADLFRVPPAKVVTIPTGREADRVRPRAGRSATRRALGIEPKAPVMISLGALTWEKDPVAHVDVMARVVRGGRPDAMHLIVGDGPLRPEVESAVRERGLEERVIVAGSRDDVGDLLAASDVMLVASGIEGMPGCAIEAGFAGLPVVAHDVAGVSEVVVDGVTGFLVRPPNLEALTERVLTLFGDAEARRRMGREGRRRCIGRFDMETIAPLYAQLYESLMSLPRGGGLPGSVAVTQT
jgi:glycosyltransferase involved in cell wall biosynthesis